jgi:CRP-like cAMP-binding protein
MTTNNLTSSTVLRGRGWLAAMPVAFQDRVLARCLARSFEAGEAIYRAGDPPGGIYGLIAGSLTVSIPSSIGEDGVAHVGLPGTWFGEGPSFSGEPRRVSIVCATPTATAYLPLPEFDRMVEEDPSAWRYFAAILLSNLDTAFRAGMDLMIRDAEKRCIATLLRLAGGAPDGAGPAVQVVLDISQDDLASIANLSRNAVGTILRKLASRGSLSLAYRRITIADVSALRRSLQSD